MERPIKSIRLSYWGKDSDDQPHLTLLGEPGEARLAANADTFLSIEEGKISFGTGKGGSVNIQGLSHNFVYAGMVADMSFPLTLLPSTLVTPIPQQRFRPPLKEILPLLRDMAFITSSMLI